MSYLLQSLFIYTLNPLYRLTGNLSDRTRNTIIFILSLIIFIYFICIRSIFRVFLYPFLPTLFEKHLFGIALLLLISIFSVNQPLKHVEWNKIVLVPQLLLGLGLVIIGFIHPIGAGYQTFGFMLLFVFPCLFFVWNNRRDYDRLFDILIYAMIIVNFCLFLLSFYYASKGQLLMQGSRCSSIMVNSNCFSMVGLEMVLGAIYFLTVKQHNWLTFIFLCSAVGAGLGIIFIGQMRIAIIILLFCLIAVAVFYVKYCDKRKKGIIIRIFVGFIIIIQLVLLSFALIQINNKTVESNNQTTQETTEQAPTTNEPSTIIDRFDYSAKDPNSFSSGRVAIWINYVKELNSIGHNYDEFDAEKMTYGAGYAHNIFLEIGYRCGVPLGLLSVFICIITGIIAIKYLFFNNSRYVYLLFPIIVVISYAISAMLDCAVLPFFQAEVLLYYFAMIVFIDKTI